MPWWQFVARGALAYLGLLVLLRLTGKRSFGDMSSFDIVVLVIVGGLLRSAVLGDDKSVLGPFIAVTTILGLDLFLAWACARCRWVDELVEGGPVTLIDDGRVLTGQLKRHNLPRSALDRGLRMQGIASAASVREARLEANGRLSVIARDDAP
jgi:uncharacterized membrane protein YcaP (DUF421 family)